MKVQKQVLALGFFDGVHLGHGALLRACRELAGEKGLRAGVVTFSSHPDGLVSGKTPALINTPEDRKMLLKEQYHMDTVVELPFDEALMTTPWQDFFQRLLGEYQAGGLVCGHDFRFGNRGEGSAALLAEACREAGIPCIVIPEQKLDAITVSSTHIRSLLEAGEMEEAVRFLGHPHVLTGTVLPGKQLGRTIGIPTANLALPEGLIVPRFGVYACMARVSGLTYMAVTNVGTRPTVEGQGITVEPWLLDFSGDLYGKELQLEFYKFLRPERRFSSLEELKAEIQRNGEQTRDFFLKK